MASKKKNRDRKAHATSSRDRRRSVDREVLSLLAALGDPLSAIHALASSPTGLHRYLALSPAAAVALRGAAQRRPSPPPAPGGVDGLLKLTTAQLPSALPTLEDAVPLDPRIPAVGSFLGKTYRLYPGMLERPVSLLRTAELVAEAVDDRLDAVIGFGLRDYMTACLTHMEQATAILAPAWPDGDLPEPYSAPATTPAEVAAAAGVTRWLHAHGESPRVGRALSWASVPFGQLTTRPRPDLNAPCFGTALAVRGQSGELLPLPLPYLTEAWPAAVAVLARAAFDSAPRDIAERWLTRARAETARLLTRILDLPSATMCHIGRMPIVLLPFGARHFLAVAVAAAMTDTVDTTADVTALASVAPGRTLRCSTGEVRIPGDAEIVRLLVTAAPGATFIGVTEPVALITLEDLMWIARTCDRADMIWAFARDLQRRPGGTAVLGWEAADTWEVWRANGQALHRAGRPPTGIFVAPHQVGAEWEQAAERARLERALEISGLPASAAFEADSTQAGVVKLFRRDPPELWTVLLLDELGFAGTVRGPVPPDLRELGDNISGTLCWAASLITDELRRAMVAADTTRIVAVAMFSVQQAMDRDGAASMWLQRVDRDTGAVEIGWTEDLADTELAEPGYLQRTLGAILAEVLVAMGLDSDDDTLLALQTAYASVPPVFTLREEFVAQRARRLPWPDPAPQWARSEAERVLGEHLRTCGVEPGRAGGDAAMRFETDVIAPWLLSQVRETLSRYSTHHVLQRACQDLEAVICRRDSLRRDRSRSAAIWRSTGPDSYDTAEDTLSGQTTTLAALIELTLVASSTSASSPDDIEWAALLALAGLYVEATIRSDSIRWKLSGEVTEVTDAYEVNTAIADPPRIDMARFAAARRAHTRTDLADGAPTAASEPDTATPASAANPDIVPDFSRFDEALLADIGCTVSDLDAVYTTLIGWPVNDADPVAVVTIEDIVAAVHAESGRDTRQLRAAVDALSLTSEALKAEGVQPWRGRSRANRLVVRPLVEHGSATRIVLPWYSQTSYLIFLQYLSEGLSSWPVARLEKMPQFRRALDRFRLERTRELEDEVHRALEATGLTVRSRIKPHQAAQLGMTWLPGEIDHVAGLPGSDTLWVIDDKDLGEVFAPAEVARSIDLFEKSGGGCEKLDAKVAAVAEGIEKVTASLGLEPAVRTVRPLFVTRRPVAAAYVPEPRAAIVTLALLPGVVRDP